MPRTEYGFAAPGELLWLQIERRLVDAMRERIEYEIAQVLARPWRKRRAPPSRRKFPPVRGRSSLR